jgi:hypothetical protein
LFSISEPGKKKFFAALTHVRARRVGADSDAPGSVNLDVSAQTTTGNFVTPAVPSTNAAGAGSSIADLNDDKTILVTGTFAGVVIIEISEDGSSWNPVATVQGGTTVIQKKFTAQSVRVRRAGIGDGEAAGAPVVGVGSMLPEGGGGGSGTQFFVAELSAAQVDPAVGDAIAFDTETLNTALSGVTLDAVTNVGRITLEAGNTYILEGSAGIDDGGDIQAVLQWYDVTNTAFVGLQQNINTPVAGLGESTNAAALYVVTPVSDVDVELRVRTKAGAPQISDAVSWVKITSFAA